MSSELPMYVVYKHPRDFPGQWVVRRQVVRGHQILVAKESAQFASLEEARKAVPPGLYCQPRFPEDDPVIYEVWM